MTVREKAVRVGGTHSLEDVEQMARDSAERERAQRATEEAAAREADEKAAAAAAPKSKRRSSSRANPRAGLAED